MALQQASQQDLQHREKPSVSNIGTEDMLDRNHPIVIEAPVAQASSGHASDERPASPPLYSAPLAITLDTIGSRENQGALVAESAAQSGLPQKIEPLIASIEPDQHARSALQQASHPEKLGAVWKTATRLSQERLRPQKLYFLLQICPRLQVDEFCLVKNVQQLDDINWIITMYQECLKKQQCDIVVNKENLWIADLMLQVLSNIAYPLREIEAFMSRAPQRQLRILEEIDPQCSQLLKRCPTYQDIKGQAKLPQWIVEYSKKLDAAGMKYTPTPSNLWLVDLLLQVDHNRKAMIPVLSKLWAQLPAPKGGAEPRTYEELSEALQDISKHINELDLRNLDLYWIPEIMHDCRWRHIEVLHLDGNRISHIRSESLKGMPRLRTLSILNNKCPFSAPKDFFEFLPALSDVQKDKQWLKYDSRIVPVWGKLTYKSITNPPEQPDSKED